MGVREIKFILLNRQLCSGTQARQGVFFFFNLPFIATRGGSGAEYQEIHSAGELTS